jgi:hypothetical protein
MGFPGIRFPEEQRGKMVIQNTPRINERSVSLSLLVAKGE